MLPQEENALKAKLRRLCERKADGRCNVPDWLHDQWRTGDHLEMARQFQQCNFDKARGGVTHCCQASIALM